MMNHKRILSFLLAILLVIGLMPTSVFADELDAKCADCGQLVDDCTCEPTVENLDAQSEEGSQEQNETGEGDKNVQTCPDCGDDMSDGHYAGCPSFCTCTPENGNHDITCKLNPDYVEPCAICGTPGCEVEHKQCDKCPEYDCEKDHVWCETCAKYDCGVTHVWCETCQKNDCGIDHTLSIPCMICGTTGCTTNHIKCEECDKYDCGIDHTETEPTETEEEKTFAESLLEIDNLSDLLIEICKEENQDAVLTLTTEEITDLKARVEELYASVDEPTDQDEMDRDDLLATLALLPNAPVEEEEPVESETEIVPGDAEAIVAALKALESKLETLSYEDCDAFFEEMLDVYANAFRNNFPLVSAEELSQIDSVFDALEKRLLSEFNYTGIKKSAVTFNLKTGSGSYKSTSDESGVVVNKAVSVNEAGALSNYTLTLESYVTGQISQIEITVPSDIVLVLDQSASMYAPIGAKRSYYENSAAHHNELQSAGLTTIEIDKIDEQKASQLGYYIAHSNVESHHYCSTCGGSGKTEKGDCSGGLYDWFVIHRDGGVWKFYRIAYTSSPVNDNDAWSGTNNWPEISEVAGNLATDSLKDLGVHTYTVYQTQYGALYDAINTFVDSMSDVHRVAVVGFASSHQDNADGSDLAIDNQRGHGGTGIYVDGTFRPAYGSDNQYNANALNNYYANALTKGKNAILKNIDAVKTDYYGTNHHLGVELANKIFENAPTYKDNDGNEIDTNKVIILFTDGVPSGDDNNAVKANTINYAAYAKNVDNAETEEVEGFGATVYSIWTSTLTGDNYGFLQSASSDNGALADPKYAIKVESADALSAAFQAAMQDTSSATITLEKTTVVKDVLTQYFILPDELIDKLGNQTGEELQNLLKQYIKVYTSDYQGNGAWRDPVTFENAVITLEKDSSGVYRTIKVTNFDYSANFVADLARAETAGGTENFYGRKLIVKIPIDPNPDFVGGDKVVTNTAGSGIYTADGNPIETFPIPDVDIEVLTITPVFQSQDIYLSQQANLATILNLGKFTGSDGEPYVVDGINNAYTDIIYTIQDPTGFTLTYTIPAGTAYSEMTNLGWSYHEDEGSIAPLLKEDTVYNAACVVTSTQNDKNDSRAESQQTVRVFKPVITFRDSAIELGDTPNYNDNFVSVVWQWTGEDENNKPIMLTATDNETEVEEGEVYLGTAPVLEFGYSPEAAAFTALNTPVAVTVTAKRDFYTNIPIDQDITADVTFYRDTCTYEDCDHKTKTEVYVTNDRVNFIVHIKSFDLTIVKDVDGKVEPNQSFLFHVTASNGFDMKVMVVGEGSVTIKGLPAGVYTVKELTDWSWRYTCEDDEQEASAANAVNGVTTVTFTNKLVEEKWLSGDSFAENQWNGSSITAKKSN